MAFKDTEIRAMVDIMRRLEKLPPEIAHRVAEYVAKRQGERWIASVDKGDPALFATGLQEVPGPRRVEEPEQGQPAATASPAESPSS